MGIAPLPTNQVPAQPPMWRGGPQVTGGYGPPEGWADPTAPSANDLQNPDDMIVPVNGGMERLGARYSIDVMIPYHEPANWQPTRATEFYQWTTGR